VNATAYAATRPSGALGVIILNKDAEQNIEVSLDFGARGRGLVEVTRLYAPALDSREALITEEAERGRLQHGEFKVTVPRATGVRVTLN
jgi:hypothetical protein